MKHVEAMKIAIALRHECGCRYVCTRRLGDGQYVAVGIRNGLSIVAGPGLEAARSKIESESLSALSG